MENQGSPYKVNKAFTRWYEYNSFSGHCGGMVLIYKARQNMILMDELIFIMKLWLCAKMVMGSSCKHDLEPIKLLCTKLYRTW